MFVDKINLWDSLEVKIMADGFNGGMDRIHVIFVTSRETYLNQFV